MTLDSFLGVLAGPVRSDFIQELSPLLYRLSTYEFHVVPRNISPRSSMNSAAACSLIRPLAIHNVLALFVGFAVPAPVEMRQVTAKEPIKELPILARGTIVEPSRENRPLRMNQRPTLPLSPLAPSEPQESAPKQAQRLLAGLLKTIESVTPYKNLERREELEIKPAADRAKQSPLEGRLLRGDTRPTTTVFREGLQPRGDNMDIRSHLSGGYGNSGFVPFTTSPTTAKYYALGGSMNPQPTGYIYVVSARGIPDGYIPLDKYRGAAEIRNQEFSSIGGTPGEAITGAWKIDKNGQQEWIRNDGYNTEHYGAFSTPKKINLNPNKSSPFPSIFKCGGKEAKLWSRDACGPLEKGEEEPKKNQEANKNQKPPKEKPNKPAAKQPKTSRIAGGMLIRLATLSHFIILVHLLQKFLVRLIAGGVLIRLATLGTYCTSVQTASNLH
ncbi:hypothetical protein HRG_012637 [Hirsutella rhossiliensis]